MSSLELVEQPPVPYDQLETNHVRFLKADDAEKIAIGILAEKARVQGEGKIISWSEFNENPDPLVNELLARIVISHIEKEALQNLRGNHMGILSIESSASYFATELAHELGRKYYLDRPPRIFRARKSLDGQPPSPAMSKNTARATVHPITAGGEPRYLVASLLNPEDIQSIRTLLVIDDFRATGSSLAGGVSLGLDLLQRGGAQLENITIVPIAGLGKPDQEQVISYPSTPALVHKTLTALNVHFRYDEDSAAAVLRVNGSPLHKIHNATAADFSHNP